MFTGFKERNVEIAQVVELFNNHYHHYFRDGKNKNSDFCFQKMRGEPLYKSLFRHYKYPIDGNWRIIISCRYNYDLSSISLNPFVGDPTKEGPFPDWIVPKEP